MSSQRVILWYDFSPSDFFFFFFFFLWSDEWRRFTFRERHFVLTLTFPRWETASSGAGFPSTAFFLSLLLQQGKSTNGRSKHKDGFLFFFFFCFLFVYFFACWPVCTWVVVSRRKPMVSEYAIGESGHRIAIG